MFISLIYIYYVCSAHILLSQCCKDGIHKLFLYAPILVAGVCACGFRVENVARTTTSPLLPLGCLLQATFFADSAATCPGIATSACSIPPMDWGNK